MNKKELKKIIQQAVESAPIKGSIKKVSLFGSYLHGSQKKGSDIDLLVEFMPSAKVGFFKFIGLQAHIEQKVGRKIDLLTPEALSKYFRDSVIKEADPIYEK